jgi:glycosyltransferase involved in cell wall biosynthesis
MGECKTIALLVSVYYSHLLGNLIRYLNRLPFKCDVYLSCNNKDDYVVFEKESNIHNNIIRINYPNGGMDMHPFFCQIEAIKKSGKTYDYFLKIHTKNMCKWANSMFESVLPETNYQRLFENINEYNVSGSDLYLYKFSNSHANKNFIHSHIKKFNLNINENDVWDTIISHDKNDVTLDPEFYFNYHNDLHNNLLAFKNKKECVNDRLKNHWKEHGINEDGRIANTNLIKESAKNNFKFYAGTIFWFNQLFFDYLIKNTDDHSIITTHLNKETNHVKNVNETYTHHLEYWFGLLASNLIHPKILKGTTTITFLLPSFAENVTSASSGGLRTVLRIIGFLQRNNFNIKIEVQREGNCNGKDSYTLNGQRKIFSLYNEIDDIESIPFYFFDTHTIADVYIATGWQTFKKINHYRNCNALVAFFCQDLEWKIAGVPDCVDKESLRKFYELKIPTFTMSKFLGNYLSDGRKLFSTSLNVDTKIYNNKNKHRADVCLLYDFNKQHRLPDLVIRLASELSQKYPAKQIFLYGHGEIEDIEEYRKCHKLSKNVELLGNVSIEDTAELYNKCELGIVFSTTNPSRIAYEMVACGTPAIEADCEYTKYDMDSDAFVRLNTDFDVIMKKIEELFNDPNEMNRLRAECEIYSKNNFFKNAEEQRFLEFVENEVMEKDRTL